MDHWPPVRPIRPIVSAMALGYVRVTRGNWKQQRVPVREHRDAAGFHLAGPVLQGDPDRWIGIEAAARHLAVPVRTMYRLAQHGKLPAIKIGRTWRLRLPALDAYLEAVMVARAQDGPGPAPAPSPIATRARLGFLTGDGLGEISSELATLAGPGEIARYLDTRLRQIYQVDVVGLMRLQADELITLIESEGLSVPTGARFTLEPSSPLLAALKRDEPCVIEDLAADPEYLSEPILRFGLRSLLCVPIRFGDQTWGVLALGSFTPRGVPSGDVERLSAIANQVGLALHNAQLLRETVRWSQQLERIEALSRELNRSRAVAAVAQAVASQIESVIDWHGLRFYLLADDGVTLEPIKLAYKVDHYAGHTPDLVRLRLGEGLGGNIAAAGAAEIINDAGHDPRTRQIPGTADVEESMIVVPLRYEDQLIGVIELFRLGLGAFDSTDLRLAQIVAAQAAVAIVNARQVEELERRSAALERRLASQRQLLAITERLLAPREGGAVFEAIADTLAEVVPHDTLTIYLVDRAAGCLVPTLARDEYAEQILASRPANDAGITGDIISKGEAEVVNNALHDPRVLHVPGTPVEQAEALIVAPIRTSEGVIGSLNLYRVNHDFDADDLELVRLFANHVAIALENASIHDRLIEAAVTDPLTGLPNRRLFSDRVDHALARRGRKPLGVAVLFLDLDGFKLVNDSLGHAAGDEVLAAVGTRLRSCMRVTDTVARLGGDEFAILIEDVEGDEEAILAAERVSVALSQPLALPGRDVSVRASIGIAVDRGQPGLSTADLLRNADTAMYQAKATSRGRFALFEPAMHARQVARLELEGELRQALDAGQLRLVYQPIVALATGHVVGAEALLRWDRPGIPIGPAQFVPLAEETGDIVPIGRWVLAEACRQARRWQLETRLADFAISVNTSARELAEPEFVTQVMETLSATGVAAEHLTLEVTESVLLADETAAVGTLRDLRAAGVHIAVDDFGTGYSSLSYLDRLPVDGLKIDRSFVQGLAPGLGKGALVSATLGFARALGLTVTAEGVETDDQFHRLQELRCGLAQGFFFSRPLRGESLGRFVASGRSYPPSPGSRRPRSRPALVTVPVAHSS
jgi:diguanylate cyclase (GGDEF)-like protein/excisionase family DNA binding protein